MKNLSTITLSAGITCFIYGIYVLTYDPFLGMCLIWLNTLTILGSIKNLKE
jgi:hypothetical protein